MKASFNKVSVVRILGNKHRTIVKKKTFVLKPFDFDKIKVNNSNKYLYWLCSSNNFASSIKCLSIKLTNIKA